MITTLEELAARIETIELPYRLEEPTDSEVIAAEMLGIDPMLMSGLTEVWMKASSIAAQRRKAARLARQAELAAEAAKALEEGM